MATVKLAQEIYRLCPTSTCSFVTFTPYPRCDLTDDLIKTGFLKQPATLREWSDDDVRKLYYERFAGKPWHADAKFIDAIIHFGRLAYHVYSYAETRNWLTKTLRHPWRYRGMPFVLLAQMRMKHLFFALPIDKIPYRAHIHLRDTWRRISALFR